MIFLDHGLIRSLSEMLEALKTLNRLFSIEEKVIREEDRHYDHANIKKAIENGNLKIFYNTTNDFNDKIVYIYVESNCFD